MMGYYIINNYSKTGKIGIADKVFERIVAYALKEEGAALVKKRHIFRPNSISIIRKGDELKVSALVTIAGKSSVEVKKGLEDKISNLVFALTELRPSNVNVKIDWIDK